MEACTLLADSFWSDIAEETDGELVISVPSRDVVLLCSSLSEDGLAVLRDIAAGVLERETTHALTARLLVWRHRCWAEY